MNFNQADFFQSYGKFSQIPPSQRLEIAFSGRSNVGKSSLINKVLNRKSLARVSSVPGKTATVNFYSVDSIYLVDLPGYGYAKISKSDQDRWAGLVEGYLCADRDLVLVFQLVDMRHPPSKQDLHMMDFLIENELPFVLLLTKADKLSKRERAERLAALSEELPFWNEVTAVECSAQTGEGIQEIQRIIEEVASPEGEENGEEIAETMESPEEGD